MPPDLGSISHRFVEAQVGEERLLIRSVAEWTAFWRRFEAAAPPPFNFSAHALAVYLMGIRPSGGYSAFIEKVDYAQPVPAVHVRRCVAEAGVAQVGEVVAPYAIASLRQTARVHWILREGRTGRPPCA